MTRTTTMGVLLSTTILTGCGDNSDAPEKITTILPTCVLFCRSEISDTSVEDLPSAQTVTVDGSFAGGAATTVP